jgi:hypothetical protein
MVDATAIAMRSSTPFMILTALLISKSALAQPSPDAARSPAKERSSHFIGEMAAGTHMQGAGSFAWGALLGFGGKPRGVPARFYLTASFLRTHDALTTDSNTARSTYDLNLTDVDFGLRVYFPIARGWRLTTEAFLGATLADAELRDSIDYRTNQNRSMPHFVVGVGPQVRIIHELSLGVMARTMFVDTDGVLNTGALSPWKDALGRRTYAVGTLTFHW